MSIHSNIATKTHKKLSIEVSLTGFSFCVFDTFTHIPLLVKEICFDCTDKSKQIEDLYKKAFQDYNELNDHYDEILILHNTTLFTFVPHALFDETFLGSYLQYNIKIFETDFFTFDNIQNYQINNVYIPYTNINNFLIEQFDSFNYKHSNSILVSKLLDTSKNSDDKTMIVNFNRNHFETAVVQNQKLLFFNSFDYQTPEDFIYYLLFTAEQLAMNPEKFKLELLGSISKDDEFYKIAYKYIRNIDFFDVSSLELKNSLTTFENRKYFILFQS